MRISRREFVGISTLAIPPVLRDLVNALPLRDQPQPVNSSPVNTVRGLADAYDLQDKPEQRDRTLRALVHIARQDDAVRSGNLTEAAAAAEIRETILSAQVFDPATFSAAANFIQGRAPEDFDPFLKTIEKSSLAGSLAAVGGWVAAGEVLGAPESIAISAALAMAGVTNDALIDSATSGTLPAPNDQDVFKLTSWALTKFYDIASSGPTHDLAVDLHNSGILPIDVGRSPDAALNSLPDSVRQVAQSLINTPPGQTPAPPPLTSDDVKGSVVDAFKPLQDRTNTVLDQIAKENDQAVKAASAAAQRAAIDSAAQDLIGLGKVSNFVFGTLLGDPQAGKKIEQFINGGVRAYVALATPGLGGFAMAGALTDAASDLIGVFTGDNDPMSAVLTHISQMVDLAVKQLNLVQQELVGVLQQLQNLYQAEQRNRAALETITTNLQTLASSTSIGLMSIERNAFVQQQEPQLANFLSNNTPEAIKASIELRNSFGEFISPMFGYASQTSKSPNFSANDLQKSDAEWTEELITRARCDRAMGFLLHLAPKLDVDVPSTPEGIDPTPVNPTAWSEGANAFLAATAKALLFTSKDECGRLQILALDGEFTAELMRRFCTPDVIEKAGEQLLKAAGALPLDAEWNPSVIESGANLVGAVYRAALKFESDPQSADNPAPNVPRSITPSGGGGVSYPIFGLGPRDIVSLVCHFNPDYFGFLLSKKFIAHDPPQPSSLPGFSDCTFTVTADGPRKGVKLTEDRASVVIRPDGSIPEVVYPTVSPSAPLPQLRNPSELQRHAHWRLCWGRTRDRGFRQAWRTPSRHNCRGWTSA
jgi:hypothetical protein